MARWKVLVVDDHRDIRDLITTLLEVEGTFTVVTASSVSSALDAWKRDEPDAVVLDRLLGRDDGLEVAERIRGEQPDLPIVLFTAFLDQSIRRAAEQLGIAACLTQDDLQRLPELLSSILD